MGRYRKSPVVIEAVQWIGFNIDEIKKFVGDALILKINRAGMARHVIMKIRTLEGDMEVSEKDFIINGVNGEYYPCKPDIFVKSYVPENGHEIVLADLNKIVEQLEVCRQKALDTLEYEVLHGSVKGRISEAAKVDAFQEAIEIVKGGGVDGN